MNERSGLPTCLSIAGVLIIAGVGCPFALGMVDRAFIPFGNGLCLGSVVQGFTIIAIAQVLVGVRVSLRRVTALESAPITATNAPGDGAAPSSCRWPNSYTMPKWERGSRVITAESQAAAVEAIVSRGSSGVSAEPA